MTSTSTVRVTAEHLEAFLAFSRDRSPLHADPDYASRTPYGEIVVPGMCGVIAALGLVEGAPWQRLRGVFKAPLFVNRDYQVALTRASGEATIVISRGSTAVAEIIATTEQFDLPAPTEPSDPVTYREESTSYQPEMTALDALLQYSHIPPNSIALDRLAALAWASYFVGMVYPGRQAAFLSFDLRFGEGAPSNARLLFTRLEGTLDDRFNRITVRGHGDRLSSIMLQAVVRPERITYSLEEVAAAVTSGRDRWRGKAVLVTGGTRGLGSVLTRALLLAGSRVLFTYVRSIDAARAIQAEAERLNTMAVPCRVDLSSPTATETVAAAVSQFGPLDAAIHNATLAIRAEPFLDQPAEDFRDYVSRSIAMTANVYRAIVPAMSPGGCIVCVSSRYAVVPRPAFSHYITAKSAIEGLTRAVATEHPGLRFAIARPGRLRTDQTNVPIALEPSMAATEAAAALLPQVVSCIDAAAGRVTEINLGEP